MQQWMKDERVALKYYRKWSQWSPRVSWRAETMREIISRLSQSWTSLPSFGQERRQFKSGLPRENWETVGSTKGLTWGCLSVFPTPTNIQTEQKLSMQLRETSPHYPAWLTIRFQALSFPCIEILEHRTEGQWPKGDACDLIPNWGGWRNKWKSNVYLFSFLSEPMFTSD